MRLFSLAAAMPLPFGSNSKLRANVVEGVTLAEVADVGRLREAWRKVRANKGRPGGDGITIEDFSNELDQNLTELSTSLLTGRYRPRGLCRACIPKPEGGVRKLSIPSVRDRVAQTATLMALAPMLDPRMSDSSWAYRVGRGVKDALGEVEAAIGEGFEWIVDADISKYFDSVPHSRLLDELSIWVDDARILKLFDLWLRGFRLRGNGIAQGSPISPLLANLYLHPVDRQILAAGFVLVRYADDLVILTKSFEQAREALRLLRGLLRARELSLNSLKTTIRRPGEAFTFLGETFGVQGVDVAN